MRYELNTIGKGRNTAFFFCLKSLRRRVNDLLEALLSTAPFCYTLTVVTQRLARVRVTKCFRNIGTTEQALAVLLDHADLSELFAAEAGHHVFHNRVSFTLLSSSKSGPLVIPEGVV